MATIRTALGSVKLINYHIRKKKLISYIYIFLPRLRRIYVAWLKAKRSKTGYIFFAREIMILIFFCNSNVTQLLDYGNKTNFQWTQQEIYNVGRLPLERSGTLDYNIVSVSGSCESISESVKVLHCWCFITFLMHLLWKLSKIFLGKNENFLYDIKFCRYGGWVTWFTDRKMKYWQN